LSILTRNNVQLRGTGDRAMVFAHGFGCDQRMWRHVAPHFEREFVTVLFDHVGSGGSEPSAYSASRYPDLEAYAHDVVELGTVVPFEDAVFVGHSCGAMIGALASIEAPGMFESLVLVSPSPRYIDDADYAGGFSALQIDAMLEALQDDFASWSAAMAPIFMGNPDRPELTRELLESFARTEPKAAADFCRAIFCSDLRAELARVQADSLVILSEHDPVVPPAVGQYVSTHIPNCRLDTIAVDGHFPHLSAPARVVECIRRFVTALPIPNSRRRDRRATRDTQTWPAATGPDLRLGEGQWNKRLAPVADAEGRAELEELVLKRAGELWAHLGRYDMYALSIATVLTKAAPEQPAKPLSVRTRGAAIMALMAGRTVGKGVTAQFAAINAELLTILDRHEVAARNCAVIPSIRALGAVTGTGNPRDWYDYHAATDAELSFFIDALERDILKVVALYVQLSDIAALLHAP
jgi:sigma-B regulation protein RsbQ